MSDFVFAPDQPPSVAVAGSALRFPVHRIYCVGLNYAAHIRETGADPAAPPVFFMKPADAVVANGAAIPYPPGTANFHDEIELVVALADGGRDIAPEAALGHVFGYAAGNDLTRRDLQSAARQRGQPWDVSKGFDHSAPVAAIRRAAEGHLSRGRIWLRVNGEMRQDADLADMVWKVPQIIAALSQLFDLRRGDLIFTGTPSGIGPLRPGDRVEGGIEGLPELHNTISAPAAA
ncbi:MAG: fumarylacetoacetate hydrolase family protein [Candidatus Eremiobacteraeota bacterium]|nr:fumarylacetoacetate hydrolase family protein [Candidatus Eremiobacteraeota bacterium]